MTLTLSANRFCCLLRQCTTVVRTMATSTNQGGTVTKEEVERFITDCLMKAGANRGPAKEQAELLVAADYRGHYSHGLNRLDIYMSDISKGICDPNVAPIVEKESAATAYVNGMNTLGAVIGNFCMKHAIEKARQTGVGWVVARNSNHYGMASYYSLQAVQQGMMGLSFTNTSPLMCPTRAKEAALGTNPLSIAAPSSDGIFVLDMATTAVALGKIEMQIRKAEPIPNGWAQDMEGKPTTDAQIAFDARRMLPLGGFENTSGYKGYGLAMLVEVLCGISAGSSYGPWIRDWVQDNIPAHLGQCFIAVDPSCFAEGFTDRMCKLLDHLRNMTPADPDKPVLVAGDPEKAHMKKVDEQGGISYIGSQLQASCALAKSLGVKPMELIG